MGWIMFSTFFTRDGRSAKLNGISQYYHFGPITLYTGTVDEEPVTWDEFGRNKMNNLIGDEVQHELDLVSFETEIIKNPSIYYMEFKK